MKIFWKIVVPVVIALYFPMFGRIIPGIATSIPFNFVHWSTLLLLLAALVTILSNRNFRKLDPVLSKIIQFNLWFAAILLLKGLATDDLQVAINLAAGVNISTLLILFVSQVREFGTDVALFKSLTIALLVMLAMQVLLSAIESSRGVLLGRYLVDIYGPLEERDVLSIFNTSQENLFGFTIPFTGMIGQANPFGMMLLFYTIYFLTQYEVGHERYLLLALPLILFGLMGNGTRSTLFLGLVSGLFFFFHQRRSRSLKSVIIITVLAAGGVILWWGKVYQALADFYWQSDTVTYRVLLWESILERFPLLENLPRAFFGLGVGEIELVTAGVVGKIVSVESEYIRIPLSAGFIGLFLYLRAFGQLLTRGVGRSFHSSRFGLILLALDVFLISIFMTGIIFYAVFFIIALTILAAVHHRSLIHRNVVIEEYDRGSVAETNNAV